MSIASIAIKNGILFNQNLCVKKEYKARTVLDNIFFRKTNEIFVGNKMFIIIKEKRHSERKKQKNVYKDMTQLNYSLFQNFQLK